MFSKDNVDLEYKNDSILGELILFLNTPKTNLTPSNKKNLSVYFLNIKDSIMKIKHGFQLLALLFLMACTPKPIQTTPDPEPKEEVVVTEIDEDLSPCKNWMSLPKTDGDKVKIMHTLYRDVMKNIKQASDLAQISKEEFDRTFENWKTVYELAPAADGKRNTHYGDGIKLYEFLASQEKDSLIRAGHVTKALELYDEVIRCYGREGFTIGRKAFDLYYKYPAHGTDLEKYNMFKRSFDLEKEDASAFLFNPFTSLMANMVLNEELSSEEASSYANKMLSMLETNKGKLSAAKWQSEGWDVVESYAPARLKSLEGVKGFYDCDYYKEQYYQSFVNAKTDCDSIILVLSRLKWAECSGDDPQVDEVYKAYTSLCAPTPGKPENTCRSLLAEGRYKEAIECLEGKANESTDPIQKAKYHLTIAKIYYGQLKKFSQARAAARESLKHNPNSGAPYLLIGKLYASSGPLCGSGRGWNSQVVTWPAIDKWRQAKRVDSSVAKEANQLIGRYQQYMPTVEDIFQRGLKVGETYKVKCWIQESTKIRAAK